MRHRLKGYVEVLYMGAASILRLHFFVHAYIQTNTCTSTLHAGIYLCVDTTAPEPSKSVRSEGLIEVNGYYAA
jgi:hypothetical protein